jgi:predicted nuclease with RNAse H fold
MGTFSYGVRNFGEHPTPEVLLPRCEYPREWLWATPRSGLTLLPREPKVRRGRRHKQLRGLKLARHLRSRGIEVLEVERPKHRRRSSRRTLEKSDSSDAEAAARAVLAGETSGVPKSGDGRVEMIRVLRAARRSAIKART